MEQVQQLIEILKSTPELALWGFAIWCFYILAKMGSVVYAIKVVAELGINKWHDYKSKKLELEINKKEVDLEKEKVKLEKEWNKLESSKLKRSDQEKVIENVLNRFDKATILNIDFNEFIRLLDAMKSSAYIHQSDIDKTIKLIESQKK